jgi:FAD/FMN-containing dehydrogenase
LPQCIVKPEKALDVSTTILISRLTQCPFAARSGGHSAVPGGSNIDGGITISFEKLGKMELSANKKIFSFQPGHTWYDIYTNLEKENLTIIGGRVSRRDLLGTSQYLPSTGCQCRCWWLDSRWRYVIGLDASSIR